MTIGSLLAEPVTGGAVDPFDLDVRVLPSDEGEATGRGAVARGSEWYTCSIYDTCAAQCATRAVPVTYCYCG
jgi:hypothetical protein